MHQADSNDKAGTRKLGVGMIISMWLIILALLTVYFQHWNDQQNNPNRDLSAVYLEGGIKEVVLERNRWGHYVAEGAINGKRVDFILDTGATDISVPGKLAENLALSKGPARIYQTANGRIQVFSTRLERVSLGGIELNQVRASINPYMQGDEVLLGMSFLKHLEFTQRGDSLTIRQYP